MQDIVKEIDAALAARSKRHPRWIQNRDMTYGETQNAPAYEGAYTGNFNLIPQKVDALGASVVDVITSVKPFCVAKCYDDSSKEGKLERVLQFFVDLSGFKHALKSVSKPAAWANMGWVKVIWLEKENRFDFRVIEPDMTLVYPAHVERLEDAKLFGDLRYMRKSQVEQLISEGYYKKAKLIPVDPEEELKGESIRPLTTTAQSEGDREVCIFDGYRYDGKWKKITAVRETGDILKEDEIQNPHKNGFCYGEAYYKPRAAKDGYYPATSVVQDAAQLQIDINSTVANLIDGTKMNVFGAFFTKGGQAAAKMVSKIEPGGIYEMDTDSMVPYQPKADLDYLLPLVEALLRQGDSVFRISQMATGVQVAGVDTATEAGGLLQGQQRSIDEYIENFSTCVKGCYKYMTYILDLTWDMWFPIYGKALKLKPEDRDMFQGHHTWEVNVASSGATPSAQLNLLTMLMNLSADPATGINKYEVASKVVEAAERMGVTNAQGLQTSRDPMELVLELSAALEAQGTPIDPEILLKKLAEGVFEQQSSVQSGLAEMDAGAAISGLPEEGFGVDGAEAGFTSDVPPGGTQDYPV